MKSFLGICLARVISVCAAAAAHPNSGLEESAPCTSARRIGELTDRTFDLRSSSDGDDTISQYGLGEVFVRDRKKYFNLKVPPRSRLERVYFLEYEGDLLLLYEAGTSGYLLRLDQTTRKTKRVTTINENF